MVVHTIHRVRMLSLRFLGCTRKPCGGNTTVPPVCASLRQEAHRSRVTLCVDLREARAVNSGVSQKRLFSGVLEGEWNVEPKGTVKFKILTGDRALTSARVPNELNRGAHIMKCSYAAQFDGVDGAVAQSSNHSPKSKSGTTLRRSQGEQARAIGREAHRGGPHPRV